MRTEQLTDALAATIEQQAFSGVVSIRQQGAVLYERAAGYADRSNAIANTLTTRFGIASGTKFFTALAIGKLIEAGKLTLATRLQDCVALDFPRYAPEITIAHLLAHTSGVPDYFDEEQVPDPTSFTLSTPWYLLRGPRDYLAVFPDAPMKFAPGERFAYSNGGYILLGVVIEELTGRRYQDFVEQEIFEAAGMQRSGFFAMNRLPEQTALGYIDEETGWRTNIYNLPIVGASDGGAYTTVGDLACLWEAFWGCKILPSELTATFARPHAQAESEDASLSYGYGLWLSNGASGREEYITGYDAGVSFYSLVNRAEELQITIISNTTEGAWGLLKEINALRQ